MKELKNWLLMPLSIWLILTTKKPNQVYNMMREHFKQQKLSSYKFTMWLLHKRSTK